MHFRACGCFWSCFWSGLHGTGLRYVPYCLVQTAPHPAFWAPPWPCLALSSTACIRTTVVGPMLGCRSCSQPLIHHHVPPCGTRPQIIWSRVLEIVMANSHASITLDSAHHQSISRFTLDARTVELCCAVTFPPPLYHRRYGISGAVGEDSWGRRNHDSIRV